MGEKLPDDEFSNIKSAVEFATQAYQLFSGATADAPPDYTKQLAAIEKQLEELAQTTAKILDEVKNQSMWDSVGCASRKIYTLYNDVAGSAQPDGSRSKPYIADITDFVQTHIDGAGGTISVTEHMSNLSYAIESADTTDRLVPAIADRSKRSTNGDQSCRYYTGDCLYSLVHDIYFKGTMVFVFGMILKSVQRAVAASDSSYDGGEITPDQVKSIWPKLFECKTSQDIIDALDDLQPNLVSDIAAGLGACSIELAQQRLLADCSEVDSYGSKHSETGEDYVGKFRTAWVNAGDDSVISGLKLYISTQDDAPAAIALSGRAVTLEDMWAQATGQSGPPTSKEVTYNPNASDTMWTWMYQTRLLSKPKDTKYASKFVEAKLKVPDDYVITGARLIRHGKRYDGYGKDTDAYAPALEIKARKVAISADGFYFEGEETIINEGEDQSVVEFGDNLWGQDTRPGGDAQINGTRQELSPNSFVRGVYLRRASGSVTSMMALGLYSISPMELLLRQK